MTAPLTGSQIAQVSRKIADAFAQAAAGGEHFEDVLRRMADNLEKDESERERVEAASNPASPSAPDRVAPVVRTPEAAVKEGTSGGHDDVAVKVAVSFLRDLGNTANMPSPRSTLDAEIARQWREVAPQFVKIAELIETLAADRAVGTATDEMVEAAMTAFYGVRWDLDSRQDAKFSMRRALEAALKVMP